MEKKEKRKINTPFGARLEKNAYICRREHGRRRSAAASHRARTYGKGVCMTLCP